MRTHDFSAKNVQWIRENTTVRIEIPIDKVEMIS